MKRSKNVFRRKKNPHRNKLQKGLRIMEFEKLKDIIVDVMGCNPDEITMDTYICR